MTHGRNTRFRRFREKQILHAGAEMFFRENVNLQIVRYLVRSVHHSIRFMGTYCVVTMEKGRLVSLYIGNGYSFSMDGLEVSLDEGKPFDVWLEWRDGEWICHSREAVKIKMLK